MSGIEVRAWQKIAERMDGAAKAALSGGTGDYTFTLMALADFARIIAEEMKTEAQKFGLDT